jgi:hypothetical protein
MFRVHQQDKRGMTVDISEDEMRDMAERVLMNGLPASALTLEPEIVEYLVRQLVTATVALNLIASWKEGPEVTGKFDEPCAARAARRALDRMAQTLVEAAA